MFRESCEISDSMFRACLEFRMTEITTRYRCITKNDRNTDYGNTESMLQKMLNDGFFPVYIRVTHNRTTQYIKTDKMVTKRELSRSKEISDPVVMQFCTSLILDYNAKLNKTDTRNWTARMVVDYLLKGDEDLCFSDYARRHIDRLIDNGQARNAKNYELALQHMERYFGTTKVKFSGLTSTNVAKWIKSLEQTNRAKEMYPVCMRQVFRAAIEKFNDYDTGLIRVKTNPWIKVKIPQADRYEREDEFLNSFLNRATNASAESLNSKIKKFRALLHGVVDVKFFLFRLTNIYG